MKKNQIFAIIGVLYSSIFVADEGMLFTPSKDVIVQKEILSKPKKPKLKKKKSTMSLAFNVCIRALEETFKDLLNKEISDVLKKLPIWIERLGTRIVPMGDEEGVMTPNNILAVLQFARNTCHVEHLFEKPDSHLKKLWRYASEEDRIGCLMIVLSSYDESILFFDELFYVLSASLPLAQQQQVEGYYQALSGEEESGRNQKDPEVKNDNQLHKDEVSSDHED